MKHEEEDIEIRSEKMRWIIGEIPPRLVRTGTAVIAVIAVAMAICAWLVKIDGQPLYSLIVRF